jgi:outer membrane biosynthesis protein TonB
MVKALSFLALKVTSNYYFYRLLFSLQIMVKTVLNENINAILATVIIHLVLIMVFLIIKIGQVKDTNEQQMLIELVEEVQTLQEIVRQQTSGQIEIPSLSMQSIHNIAVNVGEKLKDEISTEKYEQQVMQELGISTLTPDNTPEISENEEVIQVEEKKPEKPKEIKNIIYKSNATIQYDLSKRWHVVDIYVPTYKCQGGGTVRLFFSVDQAGTIITSSIDESQSTNDPCLRTEAQGSLLKARFNSDPSAAPRQQGTITYVFFPQ